MRSKPRASIAAILILTACATSRTSSANQSENTRPPANAAGPMQLAGSGDPEAQRTIGQMEDEWGKATVRFDSGTVGRMIADDYLWVSRDTVENRAETLREIGTIDPNSTPLYNADSSRIIRVYNDAAVVMAIGRVGGRDNKTGREYHAINRYLETWVRRDGRWQVVAGAYQDTPVLKASLTQQLMQAEKDYGDMFSKRDSLAFERLVADSVVVAVGTDSVETKSQLWDDIKGSGVRTNVIHVDRAYVSGNGVVGVVNGTVERTRTDGSAAHFRYANTWVYNGGTWFLLARQIALATAQSRQ